MQILVDHTRSCVAARTRQVTNDLHFGLVHQFVTTFSSFTTFAPHPFAASLPVTTFSSTTISPDAVGNVILIVVVAVIVLGFGQGGMT